MKVEEFREQVNQIDEFRVSPPPKAMKGNKRGIVKSGYFTEECAVCYIGISECAVCGSLDDHVDINFKNDVDRDVYFCSICVSCIESVDQDQFKQFISYLKLAK